MEKYEIHYPSGRELDRIKNMFDTSNTVIIRPEGKLGTYAICTLGAAENIVKALNYEKPKLVVNN